MRIDLIPLKSLKLLLRPIVRLFILQSQSFQDFITVAKEIFVELTAEQIKKEGGKLNVSRISVRTGLPRNDVSAIQRGNTDQVSKPMGILTRVVGKWEQDPNYKGSAGKPRLLSYEGETNEFRELVESVSLHVRPGAVLRELERLQLIEKTSRGLKLVNAYRTVREDEEKLYSLIASDIETIHQAARENFLDINPIRNLHLHTEYDNIPAKAIPEIREWIINEGKALHKRARDFISAFDLDINPETKADKGERCAVVLASISLSKVVSKSTNKNEDNEEG